MPKVDTETLTEQQKTWFASVRAGLERDTGKSLTEWVAVARTCPAPADKPRAQLAWFKQTHGLLQNRASYVLSEAFPRSGGWDDADALRDVLWADPTQRAIYSAVREAVADFPGLVTGQRKGYSAWSKAYQFAAVRPMKGGARLGLAIAPDADPSLEPAKPNEGWSERLKSTLAVAHPGQIDDGVKALLRAAFDAS
jgi:ABC-type glycerol-3-phosphate transport system substrate-binding protein